MTTTIMSMTLGSKPSVSLEEAKIFLLKTWTFLDVNSIEELLSYDYRTYLVTTTSQKYIFKIVNKKESLNEAYFEGLEQVLTFLEVNKVPAQRLVKSNDKGKAIVPYSSSSYEVISDEHKPTLKAFLLTYIEGKILLNMEITLDLCFKVARELNIFTRKIDKLTPIPKFLEETQEDKIWGLDNVTRIKPFISYMKTNHQQNLLIKALKRFQEELMPQLYKLTKGFIHGDPNESNVIINESNMIFFIDWQDIAYSYKVYDLAILIFSVLQWNDACLGPLNIEDIGFHCIQGYISEDADSLSKDDIELLVHVIEARIAISLCVGQYTYTQLNPDNEYLLTSAKIGWTLLEDLLERRDQYTKKWKQS